MIAGEPEAVPGPIAGVQDAPDNNDPLCPGLQFCAGHGAVICLFGTYVKYFSLASAPNVF